MNLKYSPHGNRQLNIESNQPHLRNTLNFNKAQIHSNLIKKCKLN